MDWLLAFIFGCLFVLGYLFAMLITHRAMQSIKRENEELNKKLKRVTDRDSRGRFKK
jgi:uncharacterized membrane protein YciS (DUF1049 family)